MTENKKLTFTDCKTELIRLDGQSVIVTSEPFEGEKDDVNGGIISETLKL